MTLKINSILFCAGALALCTFGLPAQADQLDAVKAAGLLKCGVGSQYKPYSFVEDPKTRKFVGYDVEICDAIAKEIGVKPELVFITGATRVTDLQQGRTDIALANLTNSVERAKLVDFSHNYMVTSVKVVVPTNAQITSFANLSGKRISGTDGSNLEAKVPKAISGAQLKIFPSPANAFLALEQGKVDAMAGDETTLIGLIGKQIDKYKILEQPVTNDQIGVGVRKNEPRILSAVNKTLSDLEQSGKADEIFNRWFGDHSELKMKRSFKFAPFQPS